MELMTGADPSATFSSEQCDQAAEIVMHIGDPPVTTFDGQVDATFNWLIIAKLKSHFGLCLGPAR